MLIATKAVKEGVSFVLQIQGWYQQNSMWSGNIKVRSIVYENV